MLNFDNAFLSRMKNLLGNEYDAFCASLQEEEQKAIYVNPNKINVNSFKKIVDFECKPIPYERCGFYVDNSKKGRHPLHHAGAFYIQDPSAMFTANAYKFKGDEYVLDMCAAPGGKSIQLANKVPNGLVVSNEIVTTRAKVLYSNIERMGLRNVIVTNNKPEEISRAYSNCFDVCLVDAPCSGEGMFRRGEQVVDEWNENLPSMCAKRQKEILIEADKSLKQGGVLIYSTCTYSLEENEDVVNWLAKNFNYELINIDNSYKLPRGYNMPEAVRMYPHKVKGEGQFIAVLRKLSENEYYSAKTIKLKEDKLADSFIKENIEEEIKAYKFNNTIYYVKDLDMIKSDVNYISLGVKVGEINKDRFEPDHYLFSAFGKQFKRKINLGLNSLEVQKYLHGDTIEADFKSGFGAILVENCPLGGFKMADGKFKNHYPKGLRNLKIDKI